MRKPLIKTKERDMKVGKALWLFVVLLVLMALACGSEVAPTSVPTVRTATPEGEEVVEEPTAEEGGEEAAEPTEAVEPAEEPTPEATSTPEPTNTPEPTDTPEAPEALYLSDVAYLDGYSLVALQVADPAEPGLLYTPQEGDKLVAVEVVISNLSGELITINALNAVLVDNEGFTYTEELGGVDNQLDLVELEAGERVQGWLAFAIPNEATPATVKYEMSGFPSILLQTGLAPAPEGYEAVQAPEEVAERPALPNLGDVVEQEGYSLTAVTVEDPAPPGLLFTPKEGYKLVAVEMVVGNVSGEVVTVNALNTFLIDSEGFVYTAELGGRDEQIELVDLAQGERVSGWVSFLIPEGATPAAIKYQVTGFPRLVIYTGLGS